jgi:hypothetical protein
MYTNLNLSFMRIEGFVGYTEVKIHFSQEKFGVKLIYQISFKTFRSLEMRQTGGQTGRHVVPHTFFLCPS